MLWINRATPIRAQLDPPLSSAVDAARAAERAPAKTQGATPRSPSTYFDTESAHDRSACALVRSLLARDRSGFPDDRSTRPRARSRFPKVPLQRRDVRSACVAARLGSACGRSESAPV